MSSIGYLNKEQFALAMYLIEERAKKGLEMPAQLSADMVPPGMRGPGKVAVSVQSPALLDQGHKRNVDDCGCVGDVVHDVW